MLYVSGEIHTRRCCRTVCTSFRSSLSHFPRNIRLIKSQCCATVNATSCTNLNAVTRFYANRSDACSLPCAAEQHAVGRGAAKSKSGVDTNDEHGAQAHNRGPLRHSGVQRHTNSVKKFTGFASMSKTISGKSGVAISTPDHPVPTSLQSSLPSSHFFINCCQAQSCTCSGTDIH